MTEVVEKAPVNWEGVSKNEIESTWSTDVRMQTSWAKSLAVNYRISEAQPIYSSLINDVVYIVSGKIPDGKTGNLVEALFVFNCLTGVVLQFLAPTVLADIVKHLNETKGELNWDGLNLKELATTADTRAQGA